MTSGTGNGWRRSRRGLPPGIFLAGSAYHGVGLPDCVKSGRDAADQVLAVTTAVVPVGPELVSRG